MVIDKRVLCFLSLVCCVVAPPVDPKVKPPAPPPHPDDVNDAEAMSDLEYQRYLQEVVAVLETDPEFKKKMQEMDPEDVKKGKLAEHVGSLPKDVRDRLTEAKNKEIERLREALRKQMELNGVDGLKMPEHIDHANLRSFEKDDLKKLIEKTTKDLDELDKKRQEEFKRYEMKKEAERRHNLKGLSPEEKQAQEQAYQQQQQRHKEHPQLKHPGSEDQLKEVWEDVDKLPEEDFNPRTFFHLHDVNGDGYWDDAEVEALFQIELDRMYNETNPDDDLTERYEEMYRMREHFVKQMDRDKDGLISMEEFLVDTETEDYKKDQGWEGLDQRQVYTDEELQRYQDELAKQYGWEYPEEYMGHGVTQPQQRQARQDAQQQGIPPHPGQGGPPPMGQGHPQQMGQEYPQMGQGHPQQMGQGAPHQMGQGMPHDMGQAQGMPQQMGQGAPPQHMGQAQGQPQQMGQAVPQQMGQPQGGPPQTGQGQARPVGHQENQI